MSISSQSATSTITIGLDVGDRVSHVCEIDAGGEVVGRAEIRTTEAGVRRHFGTRARARVVLEVGTHSPWVSRLLHELGHEVIVANARRIRMIYANESKSDAVDAETLARVGRLDIKLLHPITHRGVEAQQDLALLRARESLVRSRTQLINHVRGAVKAVGERLPKCTTPAFARKVAAHIPQGLHVSLGPLLELIEALSQQIKRMDHQIEQLSTEKYPETQRVRQIAGVGAITALCYVLTLEDPERFSNGRAVGAYLGLCPRRHDSGDRKPQLRITKRGDEMLRRLLIHAAQYVMGPFGPPCDLRSWGEALAERGGPNAKKRAIVAVARKLSQVMYALWVSGAEYEPVRERLQDAA